MTLSRDHWFMPNEPSIKLAAKGTRVIFRFKGEIKDQSRTFWGQDHGSKAFHFFKQLKHSLDHHEFQGVN